MVIKNLKIITFLVIGIAVAAFIFFWRPTILIYGMQRAGLYAAIALPMALVLGIVHIVNLAHGEMMMVSAYLAYTFSRTFGADPFIALIPTMLVMFILGIILYRLTIKHALKAPELNQLILTFGIAMVLSQTVNLIATSQPRKLSLDYVTSSATIGDISFGTYDFVFVILAVVLLAALWFFLKHTTLGKAALAVGQNPRGASIVGIDVHKTYGFIFALSAALLGLVGTFFLTKMSIFPNVGGPYTMKSFCLVAMAGIGSLPAILLASLGLGVVESLILSFPGQGGWSSIVFFAMIIIVILGRSIRGKKL